MTIYEYKISGGLFVMSICFFDHHVLHYMSGIYILSIRKDGKPLKQQFLTLVTMLFGVLNIGERFLKVILLFV